MKSIDMESCGFESLRRQEIVSTITERKASYVERTINNDCVRSWLRAGRFDQPVSPDHI